ncbi:MAG: serine hydrolase [Pelagimonas sp.]
MVKRGIRIGLVILAIVAVAGIWKRHELMRLNAVLSLFSEDKIVSNFSSMGQIFVSAPIPATGTPTPLPEATPMLLPADWQDWVDRRSVTAAVVVKQGAIVHESYHQGTGQLDQRISWSMAKSYLSALFGILLEQGVIGSIDDPVTTYAPSLKGTAYSKASIKDVLQMSSGVVFDEDYLDFWSDINKMGRILALGGSMDGFAEGLSETFTKPGTEWQYVSIDTHVLGMVVRGATGRPVAELLGEYILGPMGAYGDPHYVTDGYGVAFVLGGLNLTTRDYSRFGELVRNDGAFQGQQLVPAAWLAQSIQPSANTKPGQIRYGYQWWIPEDARSGEVLARGVYGQFIYIDKENGTVVAINSADRQFRDPGAFDDALEMMRRLAATPVKGNG